MKLSVTLGLVLSLTACANMATDPAGISAVYVSDAKYKEYSCESLVIEADSLGRREGQLIAAQTNRVKSSQMQAFWLGYGNGDGVEASELAQVKGEKEAVRKTMMRKKC